MDWRLVQARLIHGEIGLSDLPAIAFEALGSDEERQSLIDLACTPVDDRRMLERSWNTARVDLGLEPISRIDAALTIGQDLAIDVLEGRIDMVLAARRVLSNYYDAGDKVLTSLYGPLVMYEEAAMYEETRSEAVRQFYEPLIRQWFIDIRSSGKQDPSDL
jgi:hypothetical protein